MGKDGGGKGGRKEGREGDCVGLGEEEEEEESGMWGVVKDQLTQHN